MKLGLFVITSYSIHYTKLYDCLCHVGVFPAEYLPAPLDNRDVCAEPGEGLCHLGRDRPTAQYDHGLRQGIQVEDIVITSYSIHYTKLYEGLGNRRRFLSNK